MTHKTIYKISWAFVLLAYLTLLSQSLIDNARGPAYPELLSSLNISATRGSMLFAVASLAGLLANLTARWWLGIFSLLQTTLLSLFLMSLGSYLLGTSNLDRLWMLELSSFIMGIGMGSANISMNLLIAKGTPESRRRQFYSGLHSIYGLGSLSAPLLLSSFYIFHPQNWGQFFQWLAVLPALTGIIFVLNRNHFHLENSHQNSQTRPIRRALKAPVNLQTRLGFGMIFGLYVASEIIISSRLVIYLQSAHHFSADQSRMALSAFFIFLLLGRLLFTIIPTKGSSLRWLIISCFCTLCIYLASQFVHPSLLILTGLTMSYFYPVAMDWLSKSFPEGFEWMSASVLTTVSVYLVMMHLSFGIISDWLGIHLAMGLVALCQILCLIQLIWMNKKDLKAHS